MSEQKENIKLQKNDIVLLSDNVVLRNEKFGGLAINCKNGNIYIFNKVGFQILDFCKQGEKIDGIITHIKEKYRIAADTVEHDVFMLIQNSIKIKLTYLKREE